MALEALPLHPLEPDHFREAYPDRRPPTSPAPAARLKSVSPASADRLDLSEEAHRAARLPEPPDLTFARKAMHGIPPLSEERRIDVIRRIQAGYTRWPQVLTRIADRIQASYRGDA